MPEMAYFSIMVHFKSITRTGIAVKHLTAFFVVLHNSIFIFDFLHNFFILFPSQNTRERGWFYYNFYKTEKVSTNKILTIYILSNIIE